MSDRTPRRKDDRVVNRSPEPLGDRVQAALDLVLADIQRSGHEVRPHGVSVLAPTPSSGVHEEVEVRYGGHVFPVAPEATAAEIAADIAFRLQDDVVDDAGRGWPMSGDGRRLLAPRIGEHGRAHWFDGDSPVAPVGSLSV
jgi:hypothetical protein